MTRGVSVFQAYYKAGSTSDGCGQWYTSGPPPASFGQWYWGNAPGDDMSTNGTQSCALNGQQWYEIVRRYYFHNPSAGYEGRPYGAHNAANGHVTLVDDSPGVTEFVQDTNRLYVFAVDRYAAIWWNNYGRSSNSWAGWTSWPPSDRGVCTSGLAALSYSTNHLVLFCRNSWGGITTRRFNGSSWDLWIDLGGSTSAGPAATEYVTGGATRLAVYAVSWTGTVAERYCLTSTGCDAASDWGAWSDFGGPPGGCTSTPAADWRIAAEVYVLCRGSDGAFWYSKWNGAYWETWTSIGGSHPSGPSASDWYIFGGWRVYVHASNLWGSVDEINRYTSWSLWYVPFTGGYCTGTQGSSNLPPSPHYMFVVCRSGGDWFYSRRHNGSTWDPWQAIGKP